MENIYFAKDNKFHNSTFLFDSKDYDKDDINVYSCRCIKTSNPSYFLVGYSYLFDLSSVYDYLSGGYIIGP